jgi:hypothetical protein
MTKPSGKPVQSQKQGTTKKKTKKLSPLTQIKHNIQQLRKTVLERKYQQQGKKLNAFLGNPTHDQKIKKLTKEYVGRSKGFRHSPTRGLVKGDLFYLENVNDNVRRIEKNPFKRRPMPVEKSQRVYNRFDYYMHAIPSTANEKTKKAYTKTHEYMNQKQLYRPGASRAQYVVSEKALNNNPYVTADVLKKLGKQPYQYLKRK